MSTDAASATEPSEALLADAQNLATGDKIENANQLKTETSFLHSPPDSNNAEKSEASDSELSDLDEEPVLDYAPVPPPPAKPVTEEKNENEAEVDIGEVLPDHWSGNVPVFRPTMDQFKDFKVFMQKIDSYGMKSGIIKVIPPTEWKDAQPPLDDLIKRIRVREPIKQDIMGSNGIYRQVNFVHSRSYNIPQWRHLCEQSEHQPPARRGERRANADKPKPQRAHPVAPKHAPDTAASTSRGRGRPPKNRGKQKKTEDSARPMTPVSPKVDEQEVKDEIMSSVEHDVSHEVDDSDAQPMVRRMGGIRPAKSKTQSTSARRKYGHREGSAVVDETAFQDFDYRMDISDFTPERCEELERVYWKTLTYAPPLYGADLMGTLFDDRTTTWNLNKLPNILDVLGTKVPGVNTAYLYLGMWKATFAWHLEDVDLYSINYLHFGAPKQWYSISQADARRFEAAMKSIWPADAKACDQFLRHKAFLISPHHLLQNFSIKVNKCVSYPGEFVVTYPYGYHSGYNLGYNCAEAVNFALDSWLDMGKIAKKCECAQAQDSVWINVYEIERKLRGEETEYEETEEEEDDDDDDDDDDELSGLPTPPASHGVRVKGPGRKRKRGLGDKGANLKVKKIKLRLKVKAEPPCCLCPNDIPGLEILPTNNGRKAHRLCALYIPETFIDEVDGQEVISNVVGIHKDRLELKCLFCRSKRGACFQCSQKKCARAYHATCAAAAGVFIEDQEVPVFGDDGKEYKEQAFEFSCRFHRTKRDRKLDHHMLEEDTRILAAAQSLNKGEICQMQYHKGDIFAGIVVENRLDEQTLLIDILPNGDRIEVEWKWLLLPDPSDFHLPKASANAITLPASQRAKDQLNAKRHHDEKPRKDDIFVEGFTWAEFNTQEVLNKDQATVDFSKVDQIWYYLGKTSTEARAQFTEDPSKPRFNPRGNYLDTLPKPAKPVATPKPHYQRHYAPPGPYIHGNVGASPLAQPPGSAIPQQSYVYDAKQFVGSNLNIAPMHTPQMFTPNHLASAPLPSFPPQQQQQYYHASPHQTHSNVSSRCSPYVVQALLASASPTGPQQPSDVVPALTTDRKLSTPIQALQNHSKLTWQVHSSIFQKYPFYQINHNRDSSKYRTPYAPWGGFTNGYQGDLRAHLIQNQQDLLRQSSFDPNGSTTQASQTSVPLPQAQSISPAPPSHPPSAQPKSPAPTLNAAGVSSQPKQPAIKAQYRTLIQQGATKQSAAAPTSKSKPTSASKPYKVGLPAAVSLSLKSTKPASQIPIKQSPVPLPANFLAAMTSMPSTPASSSRSSPLNLQAAPTSSLKKTTPPQASQNLPANLACSPIPATRAGKVLPVPVTITPILPPPQHRTVPEDPLKFGSNPKASHPSQSHTPVPFPSQVVTSTTVITSPAATILPQANISTEGAMPSVGVTSDTLGDVPISATQGTVFRQQEPTLSTIAHQHHQEFPDVPGCESMEFVERMIGNLRRASQRRGD